MNTLVRPEATTTKRPRLSLWLLRTTATLHLVLVLAQPVLAGLFLTGNVDAIAVHGAVGSSVALVDMAMIGAAIIYVLAKGRLWVLPGMVALFLASGLQIGMGFSRQLGIHVPLGVVIVTLAVLLAVWVWTPAASRPRGKARS